MNLEGKDRYLAMTLADLSLTAQINDSLKLGRAVLAELGGINNLHKPHVEQAGFAVLKAPNIPSILVETAFISNRTKKRGSKATLPGTYGRGGLHRYQALPIRQEPSLARDRLEQVHRHVAGIDLFVDSAVSPPPQEGARGEGGLRNRYVTFLRKTPTRCDVAGR